MATKKIRLPQDIYQIKVTLRYTQPPICAGCWCQRV
jgi:hypothetical protein